MNLFLYIDDYDVCQYFATCRTVRYGDGEVICDPEVARHSVFIVRKGMVRVSLLSANGTERLLFYGRPGCLLGDIMCFTEKDLPESLQAVAAGPCEVLRVSHEQLRAACARNPDLAMALLAYAYSKLNSLIHQLDYATFRDTCSQLAALLHAFVQEARAAGTVPERHCLLHMTHQTLAAATGRSRVTVTYALNRLQDLGAIRLHRGRIEILDEAVLARHAKANQEPQERPGVAMAGRVLY